jgi:flagellar basal body-associated protein FliL
MISSDENIGDRPTRKHIGAIIFSVLGFVAFVVLIGMLFIHFKKPDVGSPPKGQTNQPTTSAQPQ